MPAGLPSAQVAEFVRALALAWKNLAAYPSGHPVLVASLDLAQKRAVDLRGPTGEVVLGVAADGILYGDEKIDSLYAQKFGHALFGRGVAIVRFDNATTAQDIETFLQLLGVGIRTGDERPIWEGLTAAGVMNVLLQPVDYSAVQMTDSLDEVPAPKRSESLWDEILKALLAGRQLSDENREAMMSNVQSVDDLSAMILRYVTADELPEKTFDPDATFGVRLTRSSRAEKTAVRVADAIGGYIASTSGLKRQFAGQQVIQLMRSLPEPLRGAVLRAVLRTLATEEGAGSQLREVAAALPDDAMLEALRYLSSMSNLSNHALTLMQTLAAAQGGTERTDWAPQNLVSDLVQLFAEDDLDRFNPPDHRQLLREVAVDVSPVSVAPEGAKARLGDRLLSLGDEAANRALGATLIELLARAPDRAGASAERVDAVFRAFIAARQYDDATRFVEGFQAIAYDAATEPASRAVDELLSHMASIENIRALIEILLDAPPAAAPAIQRLIERMGSAASRTLLIALAEEDNRSRRRKLFDFVSSLGKQIVPDVMRFLDDDRWFVVRNMLVLLRAVNDRTSLPRVHELARHPDLRVRLEAIKSLMTLEPSVPRTLLENAINDPDPKAAETAVGLIGTYGIREAIPPLVQIIRRRDYFGVRRPLRLRVIRALADLGDPSALDGMDRLFNDSIWPWPAKEERRAAFQSLSRYPVDAREPLVRKGLKSRDAAIRRICEQLSPVQEIGDQTMGLG